MKVYLFDLDSGLYEGEDYREAREISDDGITSIAPPVNQSGQVPVYDKELGNWKLVPISSLRKAENHNV